MVLKYYGLSCFHFSEGNTVIVTDPFDSKEVGIPLPAMEADVVVYTQSKRKVSKRTRDRISPTVARNEKETGIIEIFEPGEYEVGGVFVRMLNNSGVVIMTVDDVNICYLGMAREIEKGIKFGDLAVFIA